MSELHAWPHVPARMTGGCAQGVRSHASECPSAPSTRLRANLHVGPGVGHCRRPDNVIISILAMPRIRCCRASFQTAHLPHATPIPRCSLVVLAIQLSGRQSPAAAMFLYPHSPQPTSCALPASLLSPPAGPPTSQCHSKHALGPPPPIFHSSHAWPPGCQYLPWCQYFLRKKSPRVTDSMTPASFGSVA